MDLLILKYNEKYVRYKEGKYFFAGMDKASVFPMSEIRKVYNHMLTLKEMGYSETNVNKLEIKEVEFNIEEELRSK